MEEVRGNEGGAGRKGGVVAESTSIYYYNIETVMYDSYCYFCISHTEGHEVNRETDRILTNVITDRELLCIYVYTLENNNEYQYQAAMIQSCDKWNWIWTRFIYFFNGNVYTFFWIGLLFIIFIVYIVLYLQ